jgi:hypothetical protein
MNEICNFSKLIVIFSHWFEDTFWIHSKITVFSNILKDHHIHLLADSDEQEVVQQVQVTSYGAHTL